MVTVAEPAGQPVKEQSREAAATLERYAAVVRGEEERLARKERDLLGMYGQ